MTEIKLPGSTPAEREDDNFEKDLRELLDDEPSFNEDTANVPGKTPNSVSATFAEKVGPFSAGASPTEPISTSGPGGVYGSGFSGSGLTRSYSVPPATTNVPLNSGYAGSNSARNSSNGDLTPRSMSLAAHDKIEILKEWSVSTFKTTRQFISERFGRGSKTVDLEMEARIESLRDVQRKYSNILRLARAMSSHFYNVVQTQKALGESFSELSQTSPELQEEFIYNCETQRTLVKNGDILLGALNFFISSVNTLVNKTIEDTMMTVKSYENARLEYDAYRTDYESLETSSKEASIQPRLQNAKRKFDEHKLRFNRLRGDVQVKIRFLDENRVKVMHKQLLLFHNAISAYFSGNASALEATLKQFNIQLTRPNSDTPSWLES